MHCLHCLQPAALCLCCSSQRWAGHCWAAHSALKTVSCLHCCSSLAGYGQHSSFLAAEAVRRSIPAAPASPAQPAAGTHAPLPEPAESRTVYCSPAGPAYIWTGSTRSLLPALRPGQSAEVPLQVCLVGSIISAPTWFGNETQHSSQHRAADPILSKNPRLLMHACVF